MGKRLMVEAGNAYKILIAKPEEKNITRET
jgi:hypothetical protein